MSGLRPRARNDCGAAWPEADLLPVPKADPTSNDPFLAAPLLRGFWIYGLPGSRLGLRHSAGAAPLAELARGADAETAPSVWIFYGPPDEALLELAEAAQAPGSGREALAAWQEAMALAVQAKRRWRERLQLVNLGRSTPELEALLQRELPELEQDVRRRRTGGVQPPEQVLHATTQALLQLSPALLNGYLDLESWADRHGRDPDGARWRQALDGGQLLHALRHWDDHHGALGARQSRLEELERQRRRDLEEREQLLATLQQLELELDHYVGEHERLAALVGHVEEQLGRARRLLEQGEAPTPPGPAGG